MKQKPLHRGHRIIFTPTECRGTCPNFHGRAAAQSIERSFFCFLQNAQTCQLTVDRAAHWRPPSGARALRNPGTVNVN